jgi:hypothetical protein
MLALGLSARERQGVPVQLLDGAGTHEDGNGRGGHRPDESSSCGDIQAASFVSQTLTISTRDLIHRKLDETAKEKRRSGWSNGSSASADEAPRGLAATGWRNVPRTDTFASGSRSISLISSIREKKILT